MGAMNVNYQGKIFMAQLIQLEPVPNKWGMLLSHIGDLGSDEEYK
jgi:hypothetical protein